MFVNIFVLALQRFFNFSYAMKGYLPKYVANYLYHDRMLDIDLCSLAETSINNAAWTVSFPLLQARRISDFFTETIRMRQAEKIRKQYGGSRQIVCEMSRLAESYHISYRTLMRERKAFMNINNINLLLEPDHLSYIYDDHYPSMCLYACDYAFYRHHAIGKPSAKKIFRELSKITLPCCRCPYSSIRQKQEPDVPFVCKRNVAEMVKPNCDDTVCRVIKTARKQDTFFARKGMLDWAAKYHFTPARNKPKEVNAVWFSDHTLLDIFVITKRYEDGTFDADRIWLTGIIDAATNALLGFTLSVNPNSSSIAEAFTRSAVFTVGNPFVGVPLTFYCDNGKDYRCRLLNGKTYRRIRTSRVIESVATDELQLNKDFCESGMLDWLGIHVIHALPFRGCSKTIERVWGIIESEFISDLPGYCGSSPNDRPYSLDADIAAGRLYTFEKFASYFADTIWAAYNSFKGEDKLSPIELYQALPHAKTLIPTWRTMAVLKSKSTDRLVQRSGIRYQNLWYWHPALASFIGETVHVFAFDVPFNRSIAVTSHRKFLGEAHPIQHLNLIEDQRYRVIQHLREQSRQRKEVSNRLNELRSIILKTNILELGLNIPAIEQISYVPAVDTDKDSTAADDERVPEDLKQLAIQYATAELEGNCDEIDNPVANLLFSIGSQLLNHHYADSKERNG